MTGKRKPISKKMRFEVFKRDSFKCQYCGKSAPDVILHADHINPVYEGGRNTLTNLITSCEACNLGKGKRKLSDTTAVEKQKAQLDELNERRIQLEMMMKWREGLSGIENTKFKYAVEKWKSLAHPFDPTESGEKIIRQLVKKYPLEMVLDAIEISTEQYIETNKDGKFTEVSVNKAFDYIGKICANKKREQEKPYLKDLYYIRGILKNRINYIDMWQALDLLEEAYNSGITVDELKGIATKVKHWTEFKDEIRYFVRG
jgi:hypothetical protein